MSLSTLLNSDLDKLSLNGSGVLSTGLAIGQGAGLVAQDISSIAIGYQAGQSTQGLAATTAPFPSGLSVALGNQAGQFSQRYGSVAIGAGAGNSAQGGATLGAAIAIGVYAAFTGQGDESIAIGANCAPTNQGSFCVAIGSNSASVSSQHGDTIILNSGAQSVDTQGSSRFYVCPIRGVAHGIGAGVMYYDNNTREVTYSTN